MHKNEYLIFYEISGRIMGEINGILTVKKLKNHCLWEGNRRWGLEHIRFFRYSPGLSV